MKIKSGTLQLNHGSYFLVTRDLTGKQKWISLHTKDADVAQIRAAEHAPMESKRADEAEYLRAIIAKGEKARARLAELIHTEQAEAVTWPNLFEAWRKSNEDLTRHAPTLEGYALQVASMARFAESSGVATPAGLQRDVAHAYAVDHAKTCPSVKRNIALLRRVWRDLRLGDVWNDVKAPGKPKKERYRRLTVDEVRRIVTVARSGNKRIRDKGKWKPGGFDALPDVADLVTLAYHTGLRRGDCAALTADNVDGCFLRVVPAKTEGRKEKTLMIPLQPEAAALVKRLPASGPLFPRLAEAWLNKSLRLTFERAGVRSNAFGKASFHSLRATFISMMDEAGISAHVTDSITGHAKQSMHARYTQPSLAVLADAVARAITPLGI